MVILPLLHLCGYVKQLSCVFVLIYFCMHLNIQNHCKFVLDRVDSYHIHIMFNLLNAENIFLNGATHFLFVSKHLEHKRVDLMKAE